MPLLILPSPRIPLSPRPAVTSSLTLPLHLHPAGLLNALAEREAEDEPVVDHFDARKLNKVAGGHLELQAGAAGAVLVCRCCRWLCLVLCGDEQAG